MMAGPVAAELWPQDQGRSSLLLLQQVQPEQHHGGGGPPASRARRQANNSRFSRALRNRGAKHI
jgi:hypothetical protein